MKMQTSFWFEKNLDLHLIKIQICFYFEQNLDLHLKEDADPFYFEEKFRSTSNEDANLVLVLRKRIDYMQIFEIKKDIITIIKDSSSCFEQNNN